MKLSVKEQKMKEEKMKINDVFFQHTNAHRFILII